jgi:hypothetical protein
VTATRAPSSVLRQVVRAVAWCGFLLASHVGLTAAAEVLPIPPGPWNGGDFLEWLPTADIAQLSFTVLRVGALVTVWYLALLTLLVLVARLSGVRPVAMLARAIAFPWARRLIDHALGAGLALTLAGGLIPVAAGTATAAPAPVTMQVDEAPAGPVTMHLVDEDHPVTMQVVPGAEAGQRRIGGSIARSTVTMQRADAEPAAPVTWTIAPGDHLWHVAAQTLADAWGRQPADAEVVPYWQALVEHNRGTLAVPDDPDLVYPGQVFELPAVPPAP